MHTSSKHKYTEVNHIQFSVITNSVFSYISKGGTFQATARFQDSNFNPVLPRYVSSPINTFDQLDEGSIEIGTTRTAADAPSTLCRVGAV